ncbi:MAG: hypothetical protein DRP56_05465 [Planctomycetota bacterium]|nr:MAG: hypothetical protein DRP56_05465 [Planctomycetota bacterium]
MKKLMLILVVVAVAVVTQSASAVLVTNGATTLFYDDFESNTTASTAAAPDATGDYDPDAASVGSWGVTAGDADKIQVTSFGTPGTPEGVNYLRQTGGGAHSYAQFSSAQTAGTLHFEALVNPTTTAAGVNTTPVGFQDSGGLWGPFIVLQAGKVQSYTGGTYVPVGSLTYTVGTWAVLEIDWTVGASTCDVTFGGTTVTGVGTRSNAASMDRVRFSDVSYYDAVPEPATMALLGLGSLVMLRRKKA